MSFTQISPLASHRGSTPALDRRVWNLALAFQEVFTAIVRLRYNRQSVASADAFRAQMKQALRAAEQDAVSQGYSAEDVRVVIFVVVAFLDESVLSCRNPVFEDWPRLPMQAELFGHQLAGEMVFQQLQKLLSRSDSQEVADVLEVFYLSLLLGFQGRYAAGGRGDLYSIMKSIEDKIKRVRGSSTALSPRGALPADALRLAGSDPWVHKLAVGAGVALLLAIVLFAVLRFALVSGASGLSTLAAHFIS